jgi:hypothetical protein
VFVGEVLLVLAILALARRMADATPETRVRLDLVGTALSALGLGLIVFGILRSGAWGFVQPKPGAPEWLGLSPAIWLILGGGVVVWLFIGWENRRLARGAEPLVNPTILHNPTLRAGLTSFFFQYYCRPGCSSQFRCSCPSRSGYLRSTPAFGCCHSRSRCCWPPPAYRRSPERVPAPGCPARFPGAVRRHRGDGRRARYGRRARDRDLADAAGGP